jgi:hypothetical protein
MTERTLVLWLVAAHLGWWLAFVLVFRALWRAVG